MLKDASHQQVIQKFSFIESLNLSRQRNRRPPLKQLFSEEINNFHPQKAQEQQVPTTKQLPEPEIAALSPTITEPVPTFAIIPRQDNQHSNLSLARLNTVDHYSWPEQTPSRFTKLGQVLFLLASCYGLFALWWVFGHHGSKIFTALTGGKQVTLSHSEVQFIDYLERSLKHIDVEMEQKKAEAGKVVYVPVYTPNPAPDHQPAPTVPSSGASLPPVTKPPSIEPLKIPAPPPLPSPTPLNQTPAKKAQVAQTTKPAIKHTLVGVLELGAGKSTALVKVQGRTRRVWLGEAINAEGWILESVGDQQANISYQGQTRSLAVGESF